MVRPRSLPDHSTSISDGTAHLFARILARRRTLAWSTLQCPTSSHHEPLTAISSFRSDYHLPTCSPRVPIPRLCRPQRRPPIQSP